MPPVLAVCGATARNGPSLHPRTSSSSTPRGSRHSMSPAWRLHVGWHLSSDPALTQRFCQQHLESDYLRHFPGAQPLVWLVLWGVVLLFSLHFCFFLFSLLLHLSHSVKRAALSYKLSLLLTSCGHHGMHCPTETWSANGGSIPRRAPKPFRPEWASAVFCLAVCRCCGGDAGIAAVQSIARGKPSPSSE